MAAAVGVMSWVLRLALPYVIPSGIFLGFSPVAGSSSRLLTTCVCVCVCFDVLFHMLRVDLGVDGR